MRKKIFSFLVVAMAMMAQVLIPLTASANDDQLVIGGNFELSGTSSAYGVASQEAIELAVEIQNEKGGLLGKEVVYDSMDNKSETTEAATIATRIVDSDAVAVLGPAATDTALATKPIVSEGEIPTIFPAATADHLTIDEASGSVMDWIFRVAFTYTYQGNAAARFASDELDYSKAVVIIDQANDYSTGLADAFKKEFENIGGEVVLEESYTNGETDFMGILTTLQATDFDFIYLPAFYNEGGLIIKQARESGIDVPILSGHGFGSHLLVDLAEPQNANDIYFTSHFDIEDEDEATQEFVKRFEEKYNKSPDAFNALAFDGTNMLFKAIEEADSDDRQAIRDALENMEEFSGITGSFSFDEFHNPVKPAPMMKMMNGEIVDIFEVDGN